MPSGKAAADQSPGATLFFYGGSLGKGRTAVAPIGCSFPQINCLIGYNPSLILFEAI
ncbi:MAG: hypothetical protein ACETWQ_10140 [Phycisphaerae bacterium]